MKTTICLFFLMFLLAIGPAYAQDIPLFSQKLTEAFIFNPSLVGQEVGSVTFAHRGAFNRVEGGSKMNYLGFNMPIRENNFGVGVNVFNEKVNFLNNTFISAAFAYHIKLKNNQLLSMGISGEYNMIRPDLDLVVGDVTDEMLQVLDVGDFDHPDFSAGLSYKHPYFKVGIAANRLATALEKEEVQNILAQYYTAQATGLIRVRGGEDLLEPFITYRKFSEISHTWDLGLYYTYNNLIFLGSSVRMGASNTFANVENSGVDIINITAGVKIMKQVMLGFSADVARNKLLGISKEFTLRYDFAENNYKERFRKNSPGRYKGQQKPVKHQKIKQRKKHKYQKKIRGK